MAFSVREWQKQALYQDARDDPELLAPNQYAAPYPGVADIYTVFDLAKSPEAKSSTPWFTVDPLSAGGRARVKAGGGQCFQFFVSGGAWVPSLPDSAVWSEYWLVAEGLGGQYNNFAADLPAVVQFSAGAPAAFGGSGASRVRLTPANSLTLSRPTTLEVMRLGVATPAGLVRFPQMVYPAQITHDGVNAVLDLGAGHGVTAGDVVIPTSGLLKDVACTVIDVTTTTLQIASAHTGSERADIVIGSRWIRIPCHFRSLVSQTTNYTAP